MDLYWKDKIKSLAFRSSAVAYGIWNEEGGIIYLNKVMEKLKASSKEQTIQLFNPDFQTIKELNKDQEIIYSGYITYAQVNNINPSLYSEIYYHNKSYLIFSYLDIIESIEDTQILAGLNKEVNNLQRKLTKEKFNLEITLEELNTAQSELIDRSNELEKNNEKLRIANEEKNKYIGIVAHDLRSPIGIIASYVDLMLQDHDQINKEDCFKYMQKILNKAMYSLNMIEEFLDTSKIESGIISLKNENVDFYNLIKNCVEDNQIFACSKNQKIIYKGPEKQIIANVDRDKMEQVINNLITNAIKFSHKNTEIIVNLKTTEDGSVLICSVQDFGLGIRDEDLPKIFKAYHTTINKPTAGEKSTGLGLSIVKKIVEAHKGQIEVMSKYGEGSRFMVYLPLENY